MAEELLWLRMIRGWAREPFGSLFVFIMGDLILRAKFTPAKWNHATSARLYRGSTT